MYISLFIHVKWRKCLYIKYNVVEKKWNNKTTQEYNLYREFFSLYISFFTFYFLLLKDIAVPALRQKKVVPDSLIFIPSWIRIVQLGIYYYEINFK